MACGCKSELHYQIELNNIIKHSEEIYSYIFKSNDIKTWLEGDNSQVSLEYKGVAISKKLSLASIPFESEIRITTRIVKEMSDYKKAFKNLKIGDKVSISSPKSGLRFKRDDSPVIILSNGVGIAVTRAFMKVFDNDSRGIPSLTQINIDRELEVFKEEFAQIERSKANVKSIYVHNRKDYYNIIDYEAQNILDQELQEPTFYIVGSDNFVLDTMNHLKSVGFRDENLVVEKHILGGGCGCSSGGGCGCGSNKLDKSSDEKALPLKNFKSLFKHEVPLNYVHENLRTF